MSDVVSFLKVAQERGMLDEATRQRLELLHGELAGAAVAATGGGGVFAELSQPSDADDADIPGASEAPRFIRGFHDILITIGIVIALGGLWALAGAIAVIPAIVLLAEWFVKRQRLALPAFTLTVMLVASVGAFMDKAVNGGGSLTGAVLFLAEAAALALFYWRYRVPVALAALIWAGFSLAFFLILAAFGADTKMDSLFNAYPRLIGVIGLVLTLGMFAVALRFDAGDRMRVTRRSDVAFWLHLAAAPLLLYSAFAVLFGSDGFWWSDKPSAAEAMAAIGIVTLMVLIGIIIDRRAFVTSGLISLGAALAIITREIGIDISSITAFTFLAVGVIVLLLGSGWQQLRALFVEAMPEAIRSRVPPVQR